MRWGARAARLKMPRHLSPALAAAAVVAGIGAVATGAVAEALRFTPALLLEQVFTDNVRAEAADRDADAITIVGLRLNTAYESSRIQFLATGTAYYNEYWATNEFDDFNGDGAAVGRLTLLHDRLFVDARARRQEVFLAPDETSGTGLTTGQFNSQQTEYAVGPLLTLNMFDLADLAVRATYAEVTFDEPIAGPLLVPINDIVAKSLAGRITTGERHSNYELIGTAEHLETEDGFELENAVGHVLLHVTGTFTAIGRYGYEHIQDPSIPTIRGPRWSVGGRYTTSGNSYAQLEFGERFEGSSWAGDINLVLSPRVRFTAQYTDTLVPAQLESLQSLDDLFDAEGNLTLQPAPEPFVPDLALANQIVRDKDLTATTVYTRGLATFALTGVHSERAFLGLGTTEKQYAVEVEWREQMSRSLTGNASLVFFNDYEPPLGADPLQQYRAEVGFVYLYNADLTFNGSLIWALNDRETTGDSQTSVLRLGLVQAY
jgi:uncharacterized protein (PEP-CTERM system associated)